MSPFGTRVEPIYSSKRRGAYGLHAPLWLGLGESEAHRFRKYSVGFAAFEEMLIFASSVSEYGTVIQISWPSADLNSILREIGGGRIEPPTICWINSFPVQPSYGRSEPSTRSTYIFRFSMGL